VSGAWEEGGQGNYLQAPGLKGEPRTLGQTTANKRPFLFLFCCQSFISYNSHHTQQNLLFSGAWQEGGEGDDFQAPGLVARGRALGRLRVDRTDGEGHEESGVCGPGAYNYD